jgi:hypothetical protein
MALVINEKKINSIMTNNSVEPKPYFEYHDDGSIKLMPLEDAFYKAYTQMTDYMEEVFKLDCQKIAQAYADPRVVHNLLLHQSLRYFEKIAPNNPYMAGFKVEADDEEASQDDETQNLPAETFEEEEEEEMEFGKTYALPHSYFAEEDDEPNRKRGREEEEDLEVEVVEPVVVEDEPALKKVKESEEIRVAHECCRNGLEAWTELDDATLKIDADTDWDEEVFFYDDENKERELSWLLQDSRTWSKRFKCSARDGPANLVKFAEDIVKLFEDHNIARKLAFSDVIYQNEKIQFKPFMFPSDADTNWADAAHEFISSILKRIGVELCSRTGRKLGKLFTLQREMLNKKMMLNTLN